MCKRYCFVFAINVYKIGLPFTRTLPCDQRRGLLIAFSNELSTSSSGDLVVFDIVSTAIRITADMLN